MSSICNFVQFIPISPDSLKSCSVPPLLDGKLFLFDIDETLYKSTPDLYKAEITSWMKVYQSLTKNMENPLGFSELLKSSPMQGGGFYQYFNKTAKEAETLRGPFPYSKYLNKDIKLREALLSLPHRKFCFTNGTCTRADSILRALGLEDCFEGIICVDDNEKGTRGKPFEYSYSFVESLFKVKDTGSIVFFDDNILNIKEARKRGWTAIEVNNEDDVITNIFN